MFIEIIRKKNVLSDMISQENRQYSKSHEMYSGKYHESVIYTPKQGKIH